MESNLKKNNESNGLLCNVHSRYLKRCLDLLPPSLAALDVSRYSFKL